MNCKGKRDNREERREQWKKRKDRPKGKEPPDLCAHHTISMGVISRIKLKIFFDLKISS